MTNVRSSSVAHANHGSRRRPLGLSVFDGHADDDEEKKDSWDIETGRIHWPLGVVLMSGYSDSLRALGLLDPTAQTLGRGGFGVAFKVKHRGRVSVLKLTRDWMEVVASCALQNKDMKHVVPIHAVWALPSMQPHPHWASWWVIHRGYLHEFQKKDGDLLETIFDLWKDKDFQLEIPKPGARDRGMREKWRECLQHSTSCTPAEVRNCLLLLEQISKGIQEMRSIGVDWTDILPDNLLRDSKGSLRIADVGFGELRRDVTFDPPELTLESAMEYLGQG